MELLELSEVSAEKMVEVEDKALDCVLECLKSGGITDEASIAMKALNMVAKNRVTMTARSGLGFSMVRSIATEDERRKYVQATMPQVGKLLKEKDAG